MLGLSCPHPFTSLVTYTVSCPVRCMVCWIYILKRSRQTILLRVVCAPCFRAISTLSTSVTCAAHFRACRSSSTCIATHSPTSHCGVVPQEGFQTKLTRLSTGAECNKGAGVWDRLNSESTCESTFYTSTDGGTDYKCKWYYDKDPGCSAEWYPSGGAACSCAEGDSCVAMEDMCCDASSCTECSKLG